MIDKPDPVSCSPRPSYLYYSSDHIIRLNFMHHAIMSLYHTFHRYLSLARVVIICVIRDIRALARRMANVFLTHMISSSSHMCKQPVPYPTDKSVFESPSQPQGKSIWFNNTRFLFFLRFCCRKLWPATRSFGVRNVESWWKSKSMNSRRTCC